jgi:hypothetical protein
MTTAHVLPALVAFGSRRVAAWERVRRRVGVAVGADRAAAVGGAHRHRGLVCGTRRPAPKRSDVERARDVLAERYAGGELTTDEYRERLEQLR